MGGRGALRCGGPGAATGAAARGRSSPRRAVASWSGSGRRGPQRSSPTSPASSWLWAQPSTSGLVKAKPLERPPWGVGTWVPVTGAGSGACRRLRGSCREPARHEAAPAAVLRACGICFFTERESPRESLPSAAGAGAGSSGGPSGQGCCLLQRGEQENGTLCPLGCACFACSTAAPGAASLGSCHAEGAGAGAGALSPCGASPRGGKEPRIPAGLARGRRSPCRASRVLPLPPAPGARQEICL